MKGYQHITTGEWLENDFQDPHYPDIETYIERVYAGDVAEFESAHGSPDNWELREISDEDTMEMLRPPRNLAQVRKATITHLNDTHLYFINSYFDQGSLLGFQKKYTKYNDKKIKNNLTAEEAVFAAKCEAVDEWTDAVLAYYYEQRQRLLDADTLEALDILVEELSPMLLQFESRFGAAGTVLAKPDVYLSEFFGYAGVDWK